MLAEGCPDNLCRMRLYSLLGSAHPNKKVYQNLFLLNYISYFCAKYPLGNRSIKTFLMLIFC